MPPVEVKLPRLGQGMDEGKVLTWLKREGDTVDKGEELYEVETEKVNIEVESPAKGTLLRIVTKPGETVPIGTVIAWIGAQGDKVPDSAATKRPQSAGSTARAGAPAAVEHVKTATEAKPIEASPQAKPVKVSTEAKPIEASPQVGRIKASPLARRIANERGVELSGIHGTGPEGRIIVRDLEDVEVPGTAAVAPGEIERIELSSIRRTIARRLTEAWQAPVYFLTIAVDMTEVNALRKRLVADTGEREVRPTVSDILTKAAAIALLHNPVVNVHFDGAAIIRYRSVHVGLAVATDRGLVVPVIRDAHARTIREIATQRKALVDRARLGKLSMEDMSGGTFTISNLGMMGVDQFTAVLNPPEAAIIAVGQTSDTPVAVDGRVEIRPMMSITGTFDHRAIDGADGASFLADCKKFLEYPLAML